MMIVEIAAELKLPYTRNNSQMLIDEANHMQMSYEEFLMKLLEGEHELRKENGIKNKLT